MDLVLTELVVVGKVKDYQSSMISIAVSFGAEMVTRVKGLWIGSLYGWLRQLHLEMPKRVWPRLLCYDMLIYANMLQGLVHVCHLELKPRPSGLSMVFGKTCIHKHMHIRLCLIDLPLLKGSSANWRRLPFAQRQRTFYQF